MKARREKAEFDNGRGQRLAGMLELPEGEPRAYALFAHCFTCSKDIAAASRISRALAAKGLATLRFDFTGLGNSDGDFANTNFTSNVHDLIAAADYLRAERRAPELLVGHSLGGAAVLAAAGDVPEAKAVVAIAAPSDPDHVRRHFGVKLDEIRDRGSAEVTLGGRAFRIERQFLEDIGSQDMASRIADMKKALLVCHGPLDNVVSIDEAARIFAMAKHPKSFLSLDAADHLLSRREDAVYAAEVIAAWAARYIDMASTDEHDRPEAAQGEVVVREDGPKYTQTAFSERHQWRADEPAGIGGRDLGPTPYELLLSALGACTNITLRMYADRKGMDLTGVSVRLSHRRIHAEDCAECEKREGLVDRIDERLTLEGRLSDAERQRLLEIAEKCPVNRTLRNEIRIEGRLAD